MRISEYLRLNFTCARARVVRVGFPSALLFSSPVMKSVWCVYPYPNEETPTRGYETRGQESSSCHTVFVLFNLFLYKSFVFVFGCKTLEGRFVFSCRSRRRSIVLKYTHDLRLIRVYPCGVLRELGTPNSDHYATQITQSWGF